MWRRVMDDALRPTPVLTPCSRGIPRSSDCIVRHVGVVVTLSRDLVRVTYVCWAVCVFVFSLFHPFGVDVSVFVADDVE